MSHSSQASVDAVSQDRTVDPKPPATPPFTPLAELEHLLKVASSVARDANKAWADVWEELKVCSASGSQAAGDAGKKFTPSCGWGEFLERFWMIKFYIDSIARICQKQS